MVNRLCDRSAVENCLDVLQPCANILHAFTVDAEISYALTEKVTFILGGQNILDEYPDENLSAGSVGNLYSQYSPFGFNGAFWYARAKYRM